MNDCGDVFAKLSEYLDGELTPEVCERMRQHIGDCEPCVEFVASLEKSIELCKEVRSSESPSALAADCRAALLAAYEKSRS